ncbi:MAG TPA: hypothetical protein VJ890_20105 [Vineibacter sp.]|nr:hypothetical protein [Vineibacter sp.]
MIALKREARGKAPADWRAELAAIDGLLVKGDPDAPVLRIEATDQAIAEAERRFGAFCNIERPIERKFR